jgi:hypothetical protein
LYADGEVTTNEANAIAAHVSSCSTCTGRVVALAKLVEGVKHAYSTTPEPAFARAISAHLNPARPPRVRWSFAAAMIGALMFIATVVVIRDHELKTEFAMRGEAARAQFSSRYLGFEVDRQNDAFTFRIFNRSGQPVDVAIYALDREGRMHWCEPDRPAVVDGALSFTAVFSQGEIDRAAIERGETPARTITQTIEVKAP